MNRLLYFDTSAALKRAFIESESDTLRDEMTAKVKAGGRFLASSLMLVEASRSVRRRLDDESPAALSEAVDRATGDIAIAPIDERVVESARIIGSPLLRSLDAIHLATAILAGAREVWTYDARLSEAAEEMGIPVRAPGAKRRLFAPVRLSRDVDEILAEVNSDVDC